MGYCNNAGERDGQRMLAQTLADWGGDSDLWVFGYASLLWRPEFAFAEERMARVFGFHRALKMWSRINRGTPDCPGLVFALLRGGSCQGKVFRIPQAAADAALRQLWLREMPNPVYDVKWLPCQTSGGTVRALAFTLPSNSPSYTGHLSPAQYQHIFAHAAGRYGTTRDYALATLDYLTKIGIKDRALKQLFSQSQ